MAFDGSVSCLFRLTQAVDHAYFQALGTTGQHALFFFSAVVLIGSVRSQVWYIVISLSLIMSRIISWLKFKVKVCYELTHARPMRASPM